MSSCKICICGFSTGTRKYQIEKFVQGHGKPKWIRMSSFTALVEFEDPKTAENAARDLNCRKLGGNNVTVTISTRPLKEPSCTIIVTSVPHVTDESDVKNFLEGFKGISRIYMNNMKRRGFFHVKFNDQQTADRAVMELHLRELCGYCVHVNYATTNSKKQNSVQFNPEDLNCRKLSGNNVTVKVSERPLKERSSTIIVTSVSPGTLESDVKKFLEGFKGITRIYLNNVKRRGFFHVKFNNLQTADRAVLELHLRELCGYRVHVNYATTKKEKQSKIKFNPEDYKLLENYDPTKQENGIKVCRKIGDTEDGISDIGNKKSTHNDSESEYDTVDEDWSTDEEAVVLKKQLMMDKY